MGDIMLIKKQNIKDNREWLEAFDKCTNIYTRYDIDKSIVINASSKLSSAREFLRKRGMR